MKIYQLRSGHEITYYLNEYVPLKAYQLDGESDKSLIEFELNLTPNLLKDLLNASGLDLNDHSHEDIVFQNWYEI